MIVISIGVPIDAINDYERSGAYSVTIVRKTGGLFGDVGTAVQLNVPGK